MGSTWGRYIVPALGFGWAKPPMRRVAMVGLRGAGKSAILLRLATLQNPELTPTKGTGVESVQFRNMLVCVWDLDGHGGARHLWEQFYRGCSAVVFVMDSSDHNQVVAATAELTALLTSELLRDAVILVIGNKQDIFGAVEEQRLSEIVDVVDCGECQLVVRCTSAATGAGIAETFDWLASAI